MKIFICGTKGRMSLALRAQVTSTPDLELAKSPGTADVMIDFTAPGALNEHVMLALRHKITFVCGTTGLESLHYEALREASQHIPVLWASNTSIGANLLFEFTRIASQAMPKSSIEIEDIHHVHKKDAPSGTALTLARSAARDVKISSKREGEIAGIHAVVFNAPHETLTLRHEVQDRVVFALGALQAARFLIRQMPGLYEMRDVLGLKTQ